MSFDKVKNQQRGFQKGKTCWLLSLHLLVCEKMWTRQFSCARTYRIREVRTTKTTVYCKSVSCKISRAKNNVAKQRSRCHNQTLNNRQLSVWLVIVFDLKVHIDSGDFKYFYSLDSREKNCNISCWSKISSSSQNKYSTRSPTPVKTCPIFLCACANRPFC